MPQLTTSVRRVVLLVVTGLVVASTLAAVPAAQAAGRVAIDSETGGSTIHPTYLTRLTLSGTGFQSVRGGHGGIYVFFGTVRQGWRPSQGGTSGADYLYVPDSESRDNRGFQKFVAFPGSDTGSSANGGTISAAGTWRTTINVPGAVFRARGRDGSVRTVDCRKVTCGVITVGAHGVTNAHNETFTPVTVAAADSAAPGAASGPRGDGDPAGGTTPTQATPEVATPAAPRGRPRLEVDRAAATAGHVMAFTGSGLRPGTQVSAVLDDGVAGAGPFLVGADGRVTGQLTLPTEVSGGTHELRLYGPELAPRVRFAIAAADTGALTTAASDTETAAPADGEGRARDDVPGLVFLGVAAVVLLAAVLRLLLRRRSADAT